MKIKINIYVNIVSFFALLISGLSGFLLWFFIPKGNSYRGGRNIASGSEFFGLDRHNWIDIHNYSSLIFFILMLIHLILHWNWIKNLPKLLKSKN